MKVILRLLLLSLILLTVPVTASAHTALERSAPTDGSEVNGRVEEVLLEFAEVIEPLSVLTIQNREGKEIAIKDIVVEGNKLKGTFDAPLPNGEYQVNWKIVGKDGHIIEGTVAFSVTGMTEETPPVSEETTPVPGENNPAEVENPAQQHENETNMDVNKEENNQGNSFMIALVLAGVFFALLLLLFLRRMRTSGRR